MDENINYEDKIEDLIRYKYMWIAMLHYLGVRGYFEMNTAGNMEINFDTLRNTHGLTDFVKAIDPAGFDAINYEMEGYFGGNENEEV